MHLHLPNTPFMVAIRRLIAQVDATIRADFTGTVIAFVVGGTAVHIYTAGRTSTDLDAKFVPGLLLSHDHVVGYIDHGEEHFVRLDRNYADVLAMMHPDWQRDALESEQIGRIRLAVIAPLDLAVSKVARFADNDRDDIRALALRGLIAAEALAARCREALDYYVGDTGFVVHNIADAVGLVRASANPDPAPDDGNR